MSPIRDLIRCADGVLAITFSPPSPMLNLNQISGRNWRATLSTKTSWKEAGWAYGLQAKTSWQYPGGLVFIQIDLPVRTERRRDPSNWVPTTKALIDGLVMSGLLPDDNERVLVELPITLSKSGVVTIRISQHPEVLLKQPQGVQL